LIESSNIKIVEGTGIADATAEFMCQTMNQIAGLIEKIDMVSARQKESLEQVEQGTNQISVVIKTNSATAEESSGLGHELSEQATALRNELSKFSI